MASIKSRISFKAVAMHIGGALLDFADSHSTHNIANAAGPPVSSLSTILANRARVMLDTFRTRLLSGGCDALGLAAHKHAYSALAA